MDKKKILIGVGFWLVWVIFVIAIIFSIVDSLYEDSKQKEFESKYNMSEEEYRCKSFCEPLKYYYGGSRSCVCNWVGKKDG